MAVVALDVIKKHTMDGVWFGEPDVWHEIRSSAGLPHIHALDVWESVRMALSKSDLWYVDHHIVAVNASGDREVPHPFYKPVSSKKSPAEE